MNSNPESTPVAAAAPRRRFKWRYLFLGVLVAGGIFVLALVLSLMPGREVQAIRSAVAGAHSAGVETKISFGLGRIALGLVRFIGGFGPLDADAKLAMGAIRGADVSIQELREKLAPGERLNVLTATDEAMARKGWERVVGVVEGDARMGDEIIGIYAPRTLKSDDELSLALFVLEDRQLITVAARCRLEPLIELASRHGAFQRRDGEN
jgi:hypothetical protein